MPHSITPRMGPAHIKLLGMSLLWGASWPMGKAITQSMPPLTASSLRFTLAAFLFLAWLRISKGHWPQLNKKQWLAIILGGVFGVYGYGVFFMTGLHLVPAGRAALVVTINPVFTTLLAAWFFKEVFTLKVALGMVVSVLGASIVLTHGEPWRILTGNIGIGEYLLFGCIACWVIYSLLGKKSMQGMDPLTASAYTACVGVLFMWPTALFLEGMPHLSSFEGHHIGLLVAMAIGPTVLAYAWYFEGIAKLGAGAASSFISLVPVFGVLMSSLWLGEEVDHTLLVGGLLAIGGMVLMNYDMATRKRKPLQPKS